MASFRSFLSVLLCCSFLVSELAAQKRRKEKEETTQKLDIPRDPPNAVSADPHRLSFYAAPMSTKGLLSQQVRDGVKALRRLARGAQIVKIRAFVAGTGDLRRVSAVVADMYSDSEAVPAVSAIQVGALPQEGAQVWLEAIAVEKKVVNPNGLALLSGQAVTSTEALQQVAPLATESLSRLRKVMDGVKVPPEQMLRITCLSSALGDYPAIHAEAARQFPNAVITVVQLLRGLSSGLVECEGMARLSAPPSAPLELVNPEGMPSSPNYSLVALVNAPKVVITSTQLAFHNSEADIRLAFERLSKTVAEAGASIRNVAMAGYYPLSQSTMDQVRKLRYEYLDKSKPPASTMVLFEGLPSMDASFGLEVIALP